MTPAQILDVIEATWPPMHKTQLGPWVIREGGGGGKRVSAATTYDKVTKAEIEVASDRMVQIGQKRLFSLTSDHAELDSMLAQSGYDVIDPSVLFHCSIDVLTAEQVPEITAFPIWPPLQIMLDIWADGGIGRARVDVMKRACDPKTAILGRIRDRAAGTGFVAIHKGAAMMHAIEVQPDQRRQGLAGHMIRASAHWAQNLGATDFTLVTTEANLAAQNLYHALGMSIAGRYHYRIKP